MRLEVLTKDGLTYYHNKIKNTFVKQSDLDTAIDNKLDTIDWVAEIGDAYVTPEQVSDIISQSDLDNYLPKSGGTMTGAIIREGSVAIGSKDTSSIQMYGGTGYDHGAWLNLTGKDHTNAGRWVLQANNGTDKVALVGNANGTLTWNNERVAIFDSNGKLKFPDGTTVWIELPT